MKLCHQTGNYPNIILRLKYCCFSVRKSLAPCTQMLCHDDSPKVRLEVAQRLSIIARSLNNASDCVSLLLPCLIELCKDDDTGVREAILNSIVLCLPYLTKESRKSVVVPLLKKCSEQAIILRDSTLQVVVIVTNLPRISCHLGSSTWRLVRSATRSAFTARRTLVHRCLF